MVRPALLKKRKLPTSSTPKDDAAVHSDNEEFGAGKLNGSLSQSEGESEDDDYEEGNSSSEEDGSDVDDFPEIDGSEDSEIDSDEIPSGDEDEEDEEDEEDDDVNDVPGRKIEIDSAGNRRYIYNEVNTVYDSDDSDREETNTIGNIDIGLYDEYPHVGYNINGKKIMRPAKGKALDALLDQIEVPKGWTGLIDKETGGDLKLSREELEILRKIQRDEMPVDGYDQYAVSFNCPPVICAFAFAD